MKFPSIKDVAAELQLINANVEGVCDVRLQVYEDGKWAIRSGLTDYDQDHRGAWGASSIPGVWNGVARRFDSKSIARDLIAQCKDWVAVSAVISDPRRAL